MKEKKKKKKQETRNKMKVENKEIESVRYILESLVRWWDRWEIIKKSEKNDYLNKIDGRIDKMM